MHQRAESSNISTGVPGELAMLALSLAPMVVHTAVPGLKHALVRILYECVALLTKSITVCIGRVALITRIFSQTFSHYANRSLNVLNR